MDDDVRKLVREERLVAAAELASSRGDSHDASELFERACAWASAAKEAMRAGDAGRALLLAIEGGDEDLAALAVARVVTHAAEGDRIAAELEQRGHHAWSARVHEGAGRVRDAARAWERAGEGSRAARLLDRAGDPVGAARVLEAATRREPRRWELYVTLGKLLLRYGKAEAAARALQKVPEGATEHRAALTYLVGALDQMGLTQARAEARLTLDACGGPVDDDDPRKSASEGSAKGNDAAPAKPRIFGRYEVVREVASTASARVLECTDPVRGEHVAVKIFAAYDARGAGRDALARFEREVKVLATLEHPNVVPLRDYVPEGPAIVLAWMAGGTLEKKLHEGPMAPARAVEIASAVLSALGEAHRLGVLHRDVKPANVLFDDAGVTRLADFGVAHLGDLSATATAGVFGTLAYMSPEQREGRPASVQSDVFGVGVMLFEMLTRERPADHEKLRILPSGVHRDLDARHDALVLRLFAREPIDRPTDAFAARRELSLLAWSSDLLPAAPMQDGAPSGRRGAPASERPRAARVETMSDGRVIDRWIGRAIDRVPLSDKCLARAGAFARAGHPALQPVLRVDRDEGHLWLDARPKTRLDRALTSAEAAELRSAVEALHAAGGVHGQIDREHVVVGAHGAVTLLFAPEGDPTATVDRDRIAIARLASVA